MRSERIQQTIDWLRAEGFEISAQAYETDNPIETPDPEPIAIDSEGFRAVVSFMQPSGARAESVSRGTSLKAVIENAKIAFFAMEIKGIWWDAELTVFASTEDNPRVVMYRESLASGYRFRNMTNSTFAIR